LPEADSGKIRVHLILHGKAARDPRVREAVRLTRQDGHVVEVSVTWEAGDAARLSVAAVAEARAGRIDRIVAGGGDGTVNEVFSAAYRATPPACCSFGVLPLGTANDFAHAIGIPVDDLGAALRLVTTGTSYPIDLGIVDGRPFVNLLSGGFGSRITAETDPVLKQRLGGLAYVLTGVTRFKELTANRGRFTTEDFAWEGRFVALAIGNGRQAGGGIPLCPDALLDDGRLDLTIVPELDADARLEALSRLLRGGMTAIAPLRIARRSRWIEYESDEDLYINLDGEPARAKRFRVECRPAALRVHLGNTSLLEGHAA